MTIRLLRRAAPGLFIAVSMAAGWTAFALAVPVVATGNAAALVYTPVTRLVDPIGEFGVFVLLTGVLGARALRTASRARRAAARRRPPEYGAGPNEMVIERP